MSRPNAQIRSQFLAGVDVEAAPLSISQPLLVIGCAIGDAANAELNELLPHIDLFMPSLAEVRALARTEDPAEAARHFIARGAGACLVKLGSKGALFVGPEGQVHVPAHRITPVDTTSCGDSLCAGFLAARSRGFDAAAALGFAVATAAQVALGAGTLGLLKGFEETLQFAGSTSVAGAA